MSAGPTLGSGYGSRSDPNIMPTDGAGSGGDSAERRMAKYKEERRRQLASQIANRLSTVSSSSDEEDNASTGSGRTHESYSKYRRRKKRENAAAAVAVTASGSSERSSRSASLKRRSRASTRGAGRDSPEHIYQQIGSQLSLDLSNAVSDTPPQPPQRNSAKENVDSKMRIFFFCRRPTEMSLRMRCLGANILLRLSLTGGKQKLEENFSGKEEN